MTLLDTRCLILVRYSGLAGMCGDFFCPDCDGSEPFDFCSLGDRRAPRERFEAFVVAHAACGVHFVSQ